MAGNDETITYRCLAGHDIPVVQLDESTELVTLDGGAVVRICREHGAPVSVTTVPVSGAATREGDT
jgi:hypothetical protein